MSIESRIARIEAQLRSETTRCDGAAVRASILELLQPENAAIIESLVAQDVAEDCDLTLKSVADWTVSGSKHDA